MPRFETLTSVLNSALREDRSVVLIDGEDNQHSLSFSRLRQHALGVLGSLQRRGLAPGDPIILFVNDNERFLEMFWACVLGGYVPVPVAVGVGDEHRRKLFRIFSRFENAWVYSDARAMERMAGFAADSGLQQEHQLLQSRVLLTGTLDSTGAPGLPLTPDADDTAFIQFSSGSTSEPKGVVLTHRNLMTNIASMIEAAGFSERDVALSWMPLSHDMGLIGLHLTMVVCGAQHAIMRTDLFARRPLLWLKKAAELRATVLCSPNFGYQHYLKQYELKRPQGLDLSTVRLLINGAEPISAELCERFMRIMAPHHLHPDAMFPVYGLAEASLAVTTPQPRAPMDVLHLDRRSFRVGDAVQPVAAGDPQAVAYVKLGRPVAGTCLRIADDAGAPLGDGILGHVQIRGDNVTRGYYRNDAATALAIAADGWLDTGDLGLLAGEELVITGRAKDIIFVNGQNHYPHDLERIAERVPGIEVNKVVAVGARNHQTGTEDLVMFVLHRGSVEEFTPLARELRRHVNRQTGLEVACVLPVPRIPKTTSGKLQRHLLAAGFEQGEFNEVIAMVTPLLAEPDAAEAVDVDGASSTALRLQDICDRLMPDKQVTLRTDLFRINLNSLTMARLHEAIDKEFPNRLDVTDLFDHPTLLEIADFLDSRSA